MTQKWTWSFNFAVERTTLKKNMKKFSLEPGSEPWPLWWLDAVLYPLSLSRQLESRPLWVCNIPDGENDINWNVWNDWFFFCPSHILLCQTRLSCIIQGSFDSLFCPHSSNYMQCSELLYLYWISLKPVFKTRHSLKNIANIESDGYSIVSMINGLAVL